jgi:putative YphP/YqiW family bacilliredoxin
MLYHHYLYFAYTTVFAGQDKEATQTMRDYIQQVPSSPSYALFKGQHLVHFILYDLVLLHFALQLQQLLDVLILQRNRMLS